MYHFQHDPRRHNGPLHATYPIQKVISHQSKKLDTSNYFLIHAHALLAWLAVQVRLQPCCYLLMHRSIYIWSFFIMLINSPVNAPNAPRENTNRRRMPKKTRARSKCACFVN
ncbi:hypothetical protein EV127DRAFT_118834 [Xylaria flabelliformis]|nr:hypothetical protein EV127DRAFT_118834 [Xylaria flabelliformis]